LWIFWGFAAFWAAFVDSISTIVHNLVEKAPKSRSFPHGDRGIAMHPGFHLDAFIGLLSSPDFTEGRPQGHLTIRHREKKDQPEPLTMKQP
jgi:hypothetical protein